MEKSQEKKILGMNQHDFSLFMKRYGIVFVMIGMFVILSVSSTKFLKMNNILNVLSTVALNGILAMGMVFVITAGGIDLSIGPLQFRLMSIPLTAKILSASVSMATLVL